jgi:hypothetical protein
MEESRAWLEHEIVRFSLGNQQTKEVKEGRTLYMLHTLPEANIVDSTYSQVHFGQDII